MREIGCTGDADFSIGRNQVGLGFENIGTTLQQRRRKARRHRGRMRLLIDRQAARNRMGILAQQRTDRVLLLFDLPLQVGNLFLRRKDKLFGLPDIQQGPAPPSLSARVSLSDSWRAARVLFDTSNCRSRVRNWKYPVPSQAKPA